MSNNIMNTHTLSAADHAVDRADAMGLKGADRKDAVAQDLAQAWGMTVDEVRDADEFNRALSKPPRKASRAKATERFVDGVVKQAMQAHAAQQVPEAEPAPKPASFVIVRTATGAAVMETFSEVVAAAINKEKYRAVPILEYIQSVARAAKQVAQ